MGVALEALSDTKRRPGRTPEDNGVFGKLLRWPCVSWVRDLPSQKKFKTPVGCGAPTREASQTSTRPPKRTDGPAKVVKKEFQAPALLSRSQWAHGFEFCNFANLSPLAHRRLSPMLSVRVACL